jgi:hypothetical protein
MKRTLMILGIISSAFVGCEDEERDPFPFEKQVELLAGKKGESKAWLLESLRVNGTVTPIDDCDKDNIYTFYNNDLQVYTLTAGAQKCNATEPELFEEGAWLLATDGKTIVIAGTKVFKLKQMNFFGSISSKPEKVLELTETSLKTEINLVDGIGSDAVEVVISLKAK